ncbi:MAG: hypothetical protein DDT23_01172 [candidate division WS2 bacterium]|nr:hypothetical protein [Candidatus Lithacetigena glycinireducens]
MKILGVDVSYALSPEAKGKVERPYRWLQDRIVRTCALEKSPASAWRRPGKKEIACLDRLFYLSPIP